MLRWRGPAARSLDQAVADGELRPDVDTARCAYEVGSLLSGVNADYQLTGDPIVFDYVTQSVRERLDGLRSRKADSASQPARWTLLGERPRALRVRHPGGQHPRRGRLGHRPQGHLVVIECRIDERPRLPDGHRRGRRDGRGDGEHLRSASRLDEPAHEPEPAARVVPRSSPVNTRSSATDRPTARARRTSAGQSHQARRTSGTEKRAEVEATMMSPDSDSTPPLRTARPPHHQWLGAVAPAQACEPSALGLDAGQTVRGDRLQIGPCAEDGTGVGQDATAQFVVVLELVDAASMAATSRIDRCGPGADRREDEPDHGPRRATSAGQYGPGALAHGRNQTASRVV